MPTHRSAFGLPPKVVTDAIDQTRRRVPGAEDLLWQLLRPLLLRLARALLDGDAQRARLSADDLVQEAFLRVRPAYLTRQGLRRADLRALSTFVMRRVLVDESRRHLPRFGLDGDRGVGPAAEPVTALDLCDRLDRLSRCSGPQREIVDLHVFDGLTFDGIEQRLGCSASWARHQYHQAIGRMRAMDSAAATASSND